MQDKAGRFRMAVTNTRSGEVRCGCIGAILDYLPTYSGKERREERGGVNSGRTWETKRLPSCLQHFALFAGVCRVCTENLLGYASASRKSTSIKSRAPPLSLFSFMRTYL